MNRYLSIARRVVPDVEDGKRRTQPLPQVDAHPPWDNYACPPALAELVKWFRSHSFPVEPEGEGEDPPYGPLLRELMAAWGLVKAGPDGPQVEELRRRLKDLQARYGREGSAVS